MKANCTIKNNAKADDGPVPALEECHSSRSKVTSHCQHFIYAVTPKNISEMLDMWCYAAVIINITSEDIGSDSAAM